MEKNCGNVPRSILVEGKLNMSWLRFLGKDEYYVQFLLVPLDWKLNKYISVYLNIWYKYFFYLKFNKYNLTYLLILRIFIKLL